MRVFLSIELPEKIKKEIFKEFEKLKNSKTCFGNFVKQKNLHLTLRFFGEISEEKIKRINNELLNLKFPEFNIQTGKIGFFPSERYIRVIWIELISSQIERLKEKIEEIIKKIGFNKEKKEFNSHITVARIKSIKNKKDFFNKVNELNVKKMIFSVDKISLIKSELMKKGLNTKLLMNLN